MHIDHKASAARMADAYERHADDIFRFCRSRVKDTDISEDLMQETFLKTWEYVRSGKEIEDLKTFLYRVAEHLIIDHIRRKKSVSLNELQEQGFDPGHETEDGIQKSIDVERVLLTAEKKNEYRLLVMRYVEGMRPVDIAVQTGLAPNTVAVRLHRALRKLTRKVVGSRQTVSRTDSMTVPKESE